MNFKINLHAIMYGKLLRLHREQRGKSFTVVDMQRLLNEDPRLEQKPSTRMIFLAMVILSRKMEGRLRLVRDTSSRPERLPMHNAAWRIVSLSD